LHFAYETNRNIWYLFSSIELFVEWHEKHKASEIMYH
jgi:hypothetical protein